MKTDCLKGINTLRYSDIFLAMYSDNGSSCLHRNHSHRKSHQAAQGRLRIHPQGFQRAAHQAGIQRRAVQSHLPDVHG